MSARSTNKSKPETHDAMRAEYHRQDLGVGVRGKHFEAFQAGSNLVLLAPDVAEVFTTPESVNDALRSLIGVAQRSTRPVARASRARKAAAAAPKRT